MYRVATLVAAFLLFTATAAAQSEDPFLHGEEATFEGLGDLEGGFFNSQAFGASTDGSVVVGSGASEEGFEAFRWENGQMEGLGDFEGGGFSSNSDGVSADGAVVVGYGISEEGTEAFRWIDGTMENLGDLPSGNVDSRAYGASADGSVVVGRGHVDDGYETFRWENGTMEGLGDLDGGSFYSEAHDVSADGSVVVGESTSGEGLEAFRWESGEMEGLGDFEGGGFSSQAHAVSADGSVIIGVGSVDGGSRAFRWENGTMENLGVPDGSSSSTAMDVSADGSVVVGFGVTGAGESFDAFIWTAEDGMRKLKDLLENDYGLDLTGWMLTYAYGISGDGTTIVGTGSNPDGNVEAWRAVIPHTIADEATPEALADVLSAPRPNPANETSTLTIAVERGQHVAVEVFDVTGRRVQTVYENALAGGMRETLTLDASALPAGVYVIRATGEDFTETRQVTVIR